MLPQLDPTWYASQSLWMLITFCALFLAMGKLVLPVIVAVVEGRQHRLGDDLKKAEALKNEASRILKEYQNGLASAKERIRFKMAEVNRKNELAFKDQEQAFSKRLYDQIAQEEGKLEQAKEKALLSVSDISKELVVDIVQKIAGVSPSVAVAEKQVKMVMKEGL